MAWTYSGNPASSDRDNLRFLIQDTNTNDQLFSDEELDFLLTQNTSVKSSALSAIKTLIAKFSRMVNKKVDDLSISYSDRVKHYKDLEKVMKREVALANGGVIVGGLSKSRKESVVSDTDRVDQEFTKGQFDRT